MKNKKLNLTLLIFSLIISSLLLMFSYFYQRRFVKVRIANVEVHAEIANTPIKRMVGLMNRSELKENEGMLFVFEREGVYKFWMFNMKFPIDIIWISKDKTIIGCSEDLKPCRLNCIIYEPPEPILYALEVNSGFCKKYKIRAGDKVKFAKVI